MTFPDDPEVAKLRRSYHHGELLESDVESDPLALFRQWLHEAIEGEVPEPNAMVVATATPGGVPSARTVLLKGLDEQGLVFYTNYESGKAADLAVNPVVAVVFPWHAMERQVRITGEVSKVDREESEAYFRSRPWESRLGAWASAQSTVVPDRETLDRSYQEMVERWPDEDADIPVPDFWGGYRVSPISYEFWQGRMGRLHDRLRYRLVEGSWVLERLAP